MPKGDAVPAAMVEPGPPVRQPHGIEAIEIAEGALQPDRGRMQPSHGWKTPFRALNGRHEDLLLALVEHGHVDRRHLAPKAEQGSASLGQPRRQELPKCIVHDEFRGQGLWPAALRPLAISSAIVGTFGFSFYSGHTAIGSSLSRAAAQCAETKPQAAAAK